ncbi:hypothetical protein AJ79_03897 [Helicocarpus griseus UAMH5409]|uniref:Uncharacterized protein n=1 Tax=Helicocarpus griseus UAMH5409 TaxID=1447875 RepID=A0A2B7XVM3_9EURO|nr:hypothetical protein AJ79_03897 [Helicocarpus griseus UAMH5409]
MALPIQISDVLVLSQLAWKIYNFAFDKKLRPSAQYSDFVNDIRSLATNLHNVYRVASNAASQLEASSLGRSRDSKQLWDLTSLNEIVGDYHKTLRDCEKLLRDNYRYNNASGPVQGITFGILVQPEVDRLRSRLSLHNLKILFFLKPFEIDLLLRVHQDLSHRMTRMHDDLRRLMGVVVPDFKEELEHQEAQQTCTLEIPPEFSLRFQKAAEKAYPELLSGSQLPLAETANAFVLNFEKSTRNSNTVRCGLFGRNTVTMAAYINLLKCVWLMKHLEQYQTADDFGPSHWPSYLRELKQELSQECRRFSPESIDRIFAPDLSRARLDPSSFNIWPEARRSSNLPSGHRRNWPTREIVTLPLQSDSESVVTSLSFLQVLDNTPFQYRLIATAEERLENGTIMSEERVIDVNLETALLIPLYAMPTLYRDTNDVLLRTPSEETRFSFCSMKDLLRFQHAFTGYKPYLAYSQMNAKVAFVVSNDKPIVEDAVVQLWIPKRLDTQYIVNESGGHTDEPWPESREIPPTIPVMNLPDGSNSSFPDMLPEIRPGAFSFQDPFNAPPSDQQSFGSLSSSTALSGSRSASFSSGERERSMSLPSVVPYSNQRRLTVASVASESNKSTVTVLNMGNATKFLHQKPSRPTLVIFSRSVVGNNELSITSVKIDDGTAVNTERCDCRRAISSCAITAIEQNKGKYTLESQRYVAKKGLEDFDVGRLGFARRKENHGAQFKGLKRISISFKDANDRKLFGGYKCHCKSDTWRDLYKCIGDGHQGILGEVKAIGQKELRAFHQAAEGRADIVIGQAPPAV